MLIELYRANELKTEKQLLHKRIRNINKSLYLCGLKREVCYTRLKNLIQDREVLQQCTSPIHWLRNYDTTKFNYKNMAKFNKLSAKQIGYMYNSTSRCPNGRDTSVTLVTNSSHSDTPMTITISNHNHNDGSTTAATTITTSNQSNLTTTTTNNKCIINL